MTMPRPLLASALALGLTLLARPALACGSRDDADVAELLAPARHLLDELLGGYDYERDDAFRFLHPFVLAGYDPDGLLALAHGISEEWADEGAANGVPRVRGTALDDALKKGDLARARKEAGRIVALLLARPQPVASLDAPLLQRAVELLELSTVAESLPKPLVTQFFVARANTPLAVPPTLALAAKIRDTAMAQLPALLPEAADDPRLPSLELVQLRERVHHELGSGWPGQIEAPARVWRGLEAGYDAWLAKHGAHPLADFARLEKLRVLYLHADAPAAWDLLLALYPRQRLRAIWEMRHLILNDIAPKQLDLAKIAELPLLSALIEPSSELKPESFRALWSRAVAAEPSPVALNLEARLMNVALRMIREGRTVAIPGEARRPSEQWAQLHTAVLLAQKRNDEALKQARLLEDASFPSRALLTQCLLAQGDWVAALRTMPSQVSHGGGPSELSEGARYLLEVAAPQSALEVVREDASPIGRAATMALVLRRLGEVPDWNVGATWFAKLDPKRSRAYAEAAKLARDESAEGKLRMARWLSKGKSALLFDEHSRAYSRGLKNRHELLSGGFQREDARPIKDDLQVEGEHARLKQTLLYGGRRQHALALYVEALSKLDASAKQARQALKEADALYNQLLNWDVSENGAYHVLLQQSPVASALREAGKRIRGTP